MIVLSTASKYFKIKRLGTEFKKLVLRYNFNYLIKTDMK